MPFESTGFEIELEKATPTPYNEETLKKQLAAIGLKCSEITEPNLTRWLTEVKSQLPDGKIQAFGIMETPKTLRTALALHSGRIRPLEEAMSRLTDSPSVLANWTISGSGQGYGPNLEVIQYPDHFKWLHENRGTNGFTGVVDNPPDFTGKFPTTEGIKNLFVSAGQTASATLVKGLDKDTLQAMFSNVIKPLDNAKLDNYDVSDSRTLFLVDNYNTTTGKADGVGVLYVSWRLQIKDFKQKQKYGGDQHDTTLTVKSGSVLYTDPANLCRDYNSVLTHFMIDPVKSPPCRTK